MSEGNDPLFVVMFTLVRDCNNSIINSYYKKKYFLVFGSYLFHINGGQEPLKKLHTRMRIGVNKLICLVFIEFIYQ